MLLVGAISAITFWITQRDLNRRVEDELQRNFQNQIDAMHDARVVRFTLLAERCRQLVRHQRIRAVFDDNALDLLYPSAAGELRDLLGDDEDSAEFPSHIQRAQFYRFLDEKGRVIPPAPTDHVGILEAEESQLTMGGVPEKQQVGYLIAQRADGHEIIDEVIATPIFSGESGEPIAALALGFKPAEISAGLQPHTGLTNGIWLNGHLHLPATSRSAAASLEGLLTHAVTIDHSLSGRLLVQIEGVPHYLFFELLNPDSRFPSAYEVSLYSLADTLTQQRHLRWQILGTGGILLLCGLIGSLFLSGRLSAPVEKLEVASAEHAVQRSRAEAALEVTDQELRVRNTELQKALTSLEAAQQQVIQQERLRALGQMASGIAHDFNNALVPILGYCELLQMSPAALDDRKKTLGYLETIQTAARDAASVVSRLREFYRAKEADEEFVPVNLKVLAEQAVKLTQPRWKGQAQANGATVEIVTQFADIPAVSGNESEVREVLTNLIFNAVDAMPHGGTITIRTRCDEDRAILEVADTGTGMSEEVRLRCLEPFFSTKGERGTGLGLSMVFGIVQRHHGQIEVTSELGHGTTFTIFLPFHQEEQKATGASESPATRPLRVLVVDDEAPVRDLLAAVLKNDGHHVNVADHGMAGLRLFMDGNFELVVTDKAMPVMSGDQMAAAIKQISPNTPIILLTGFGQFLEGDKVPNVDVLAAKPIGVVAIREAIAQALAFAS